MHPADGVIAEDEFVVVEDVVVDTAAVIAVCAVNRKDRQASVFAASNMHK